MRGFKASSIRRCTWSALHYSAGGRTGETDFTAREQQSAHHCGSSVFQLQNRKMGKETNSYCLH